MNFYIASPNRSANDMVRDLQGTGIAQKIKDLQAYDELTEVKGKIPLDGFSEGKGNNGPMFLPTFNLVKGRNRQCIPPDDNTGISPQCFDIKSGDREALSWKNRILYKDPQSLSEKKTTCTHYGRMDMEGGMTFSDSCGTWGVFVIS